MSMYNENSIKILEGLDAVRKRPGMYIGSTDIRGLHHLVWEIVDNSMDEALNGYGNQIIVTLHADNSVSVSDFGRGIPTGIHESGVPTSQVIFSNLHAGGKFGDGGYKTSGGLHGVGSSVVNALSTKLEITINRNKKQYKQIFNDGGNEISKLEVVGKSTKSGTTVRFWPNSKIFSDVVYDANRIKKRMQQSAFLNSKLSMILIDERDSTKHEYYYEHGLSEFIKYLSESKKDLVKPIMLEVETCNEIEVEIGLIYTDGYNEEIVSFVNNVRTGDGGTHEIGFKSALTKVINEYARNNNLLKVKDKNLEGSDVREGLIAIISVKIPEHILQFEGQTKSKLGTPIARNAVEGVVLKQLEKYCDFNNNETTKIIEKALKSRDVRLAAKKARLDARKEKGSRKEIILSGKLTPAQSKKPEERELFLVEGDSAGGSAKQGRDRKTQAILPLRGKVVNTQKARLEEVLKNEELATIINTLGASVGSDFDINSINYNKIIIMTDADTDGAHIQILLLTFFYRYMRPLIEKGHIYMAQPPLYKVSTYDNKQVVYAWDERQLHKECSKFTKKYYIQRYKGLGEMDAQQLWDTTMNPKDRVLIRVKIEDLINAELDITTLMGDEVIKRREWIEANVDFDTLDDFEIGVKK